MSGDAYDPTVAMPAPRRHGPALPAAGDTVAGRYRLEAPVGRGGMGIVWRARDEVLERTVAVKQVVIPQLVDEREADLLRERVLREARAAGRVRHPAAVTVYDVVEQDGTPYLVMELVEARTLADVVREEGPLDPAETARVGLAVLGALEAAHAVGVVHRDVKPGNVMISGYDHDGSPGRVLLADFGIASTQGDPSITQTGFLVGSPAYISPERARGAAGGPPGDIWSLASTLFSAVEGRPAYDGDGALGTLTAVVEGRRRDPERAGPVLGSLLVDILDSAPEQRPEAAEVRGRLARVTDAPGPVPERTSYLPAEPLPPLRDTTIAMPSVRVVEEGLPVHGAPAPRRTGVIAAVVLAVLAVGALVGVLVARGGGSGSAASAIPATGFTKVVGAAGWSVGIPDGWQHSAADGADRYARDATTGVDVRVLGPTPARAYLGTLADAAGATRSAFVVPLGRPGETSPSPSPSPTTSRSPRSTPSPSLTTVDSPSPSPSRVGPLSSPTDVTSVSPSPSTVDQPSTTNVAVPSLTTSDSPSPVATTTSAAASRSASPSATPSPSTTPTGAYTQLQLGGDPDRATWEYTKRQGSVVLHHRVTAVRTTGHLTVLEITSTDSEWVGLGGTTSAGDLPFSVITRSFTAAP